MVNRHEIGLTTQLSETVKLHTSRRLVSRSSMVMGGLSEKILYCRSLIEEHAATCGGHVSMSPTRQVPCPICTEMFPHNLIERHAATCGEGLTV